MRRTILYFGNGWFTENRTSSHHVARWLGQRNDVYYFECPGLRAPTGNARDIRKAIAQVTRAFRAPVKAAEGVSVRPLLQIPFHRFGPIRALNRLIVRATVRYFMWQRGIKAPLVWATVPHVSSLVGSLPSAGIVYYCIDDYSALPGVDAGTVRDMDAELTGRADIVFVASETLLETKKRINPETHHSPHGVDVEHFGTAQASPELLPGIGMPPAPVIGFFGVIENYVDMALLDRLARARPHWTFLMIGRVAVPPDRVPVHDNLLFVGPKPYESLPDYGRHFTVAIIPYRQTDFTFHANPLKLREYLAMGKPVVTLRTPQTERFADIVDVVSTVDEWLDALDRAVAMPQTQEQVKARQRYVGDASWDARLERVWSLVERRLSSLGSVSKPAQPAMEPADDTRGADRVAGRTL